jgi:hypothetical protein
LGWSKKKKKLLEELVASYRGAGKVRRATIYFVLKNINFKIYRTIILPVVLYGCETWSLKLREEHRLK